MVSSSSSVSAGATTLAAAPRTAWAKGWSRRINSRLRKITHPTANKGSTVTPSGLAERESNHSPAHTASSVTVVSPEDRAA